MRGFRLVEAKVVVFESPGVVVFKLTLVELGVVESSELGPRKKISTYST